jgi:hypothetical protein
LTRKTTPLCPAGKKVYSSLSWVSNSVKRNKKNC